MPRACLFFLGLLVATLLPQSVRAADRTEQRNTFRAALAAATRPPEGAWKRYAAELDASYPLYPYIELAALREKPQRLRREDVERFLARWPDTLPARDLRETWLRELARREDWATFRAFDQGSKDTGLRCDALHARLAGGDTIAFEADFSGIWNGDRALPESCDAAIAALRASGTLDDARVWERIERAAAAGRADAVAQAAALLSGAARTDADRVTAALRDPVATFAKAKNWPDTARARDALAFGLARHARRNSGAAETAWADLEPRFQWSEAQKNRILHAIALYRATSYAPDATARLDALPASADDDATREWRVRTALVARDFPRALAALDRLSDTQKADPQWQYLRGRVLMKLDRDAEARAAFEQAAREATFSGFLAADWIDRPYSICPDTLAADAAAEAALAAQPDLVRAFEFRALSMHAEARREWNFAMEKLDPRMRRLAADHAYRQGWYDRAVFALSADPETRRVYEQRFPLGMEKQVRREAKAAGIDPAWAYAIIRAESAWMTDARSHANAYGLMQLLPSTARQVAKAAKLRYGNANDLLDPALNIQLGTRHLAEMAAVFDGSPWLASAAYNAGAGAVRRWRDARGSLEPDFFIETIPYKETREYVARVLAFSVIYDWRMNERPLPLSSRMPRIGQPWRAPPPDAPRKPVVCAAPAADAAS